MLPLSCEMSAHKKTRSAHTFSCKSWVLHIFYMSFEIYMSTDKMLHTGNFARTQTLKIRGNIDQHYMVIAQKHMFEILT